jgi:radical SAM superfamily enzyme YgiQ (UPF0313 family)
MNVLLLYPEFPDTFWSFKHALKFVRKRASMPPLGLLTMAALLPQTWNLRLIDLNVTKLTERDLAWADQAFVSAMTVQRESARQMISRCKAAGLTVVAGGPLFTMESEQFPEVDHFVLNEAELTLPPFLADLAQGTSWTPRPRRIYTTEDYADIRQSPTPLWRLADRRRYASMGVQFSRGCPFNCDFCNVTSLLGHKPRTKSSSQILAELNGLYELGWRGRVFFVDDNLIGNKKYLKEELLPVLIEWRRGKSGMPFNTEASINLADDEELMRLMVAAGFDQVFVGIETPANEGLAECNKKQNVNRDLVADVKRLQQAGLEVQGGFIVGFDSDTADIFARQVEFIQRSGIVTAMVGMLQAPVGTKLYERLAGEGRLLGAASGDNVDGATNIVPLMSREALYEGYRSVLQHLYAPEHYYARVKTFLLEYRPPKITAPLDTQQVLALFRSIVHLGIVGRERLEYWRLFLWTLFRRPDLFPLAITLAIYGYHFRQVCDLHIG